MEEQKNQKTYYILLYNCYDCSNALKCICISYSFKKENYSNRLRNILTQIDSGKVKYVEIQDDQIAFIAINEKDEEGIYITGRMDDRTG